MYVYIDTCVYTWTGIGVGPMTPLVMVISYRVKFQNIRNMFRVI